MSEFFTIGRAGELVSALCRELQNGQDDPENIHILAVRLIFCLYSDGIGTQSFRMFLARFRGRPERLSEELQEYFSALDTPETGGLFSQSVKVPPISANALSILLTDFSWEQMTPADFGALFESCLSPETRRKAGIHYTSLENIHRLIDPLFLDNLKDEMREISEIPDARERSEQAELFQKKLAGLNFLDPACGSGNFLTETFTALKLLERKAMKHQNSPQERVSVRQFQGFEIDPFAASVARVSLQMASRQLSAAPETVTGIIEINALQARWKELVPACGVRYIIGNPPFSGYSNQSKIQKADIKSVYTDEHGKPYPSSGKIDYAAGWLFRSCEMMQDNYANAAALVLPDSVCRGVQTAAVWKPLRERFGVEIHFAWPSFAWDSEGTGAANVHVSIVGFSLTGRCIRRIFRDGDVQEVENISPYLQAGPWVFVEKRNRPLQNFVKPMIAGNRMLDNKCLTFTAGEYEKFIEKEPEAEKFVKRLASSREFINGIDRYCLWLKNAEPAEIDALPLVRERVQACRESRLSGSPEQRKLADAPALFEETKNPDSYLAVPHISSSRRRYVPVAFLDAQTIPTDGLRILPDATLYDFGILTSSAHMAWLRAFGSRLNADYSYINSIVYNAFPWPEPDEDGRRLIEQTAQKILDARAAFPDATLAGLYEPGCMPFVLWNAHRANDAAVLLAYGLDPQLAHGFGKYPGEREIIAALLSRYQQISGENPAD